MQFYPHFASKWNKTAFRLCNHPNQSPKHLKTILQNIFLNREQPLNRVWYIWLTRVGLHEEYRLIFWAVDKNSVSVNSYDKPTHSGQSAPCVISSLICGVSEIFLRNLQNILGLDYYYYNLAILHPHYLSPDFWSAIIFDILSMHADELIWHQSCLQVEEFQHNDPYAKDGDVDVVLRIGYALSSSTFETGIVLTTKDIYESILL